MRRLKTGGAARAAILVAALALSVILFRGPLVRGAASLVLGALTGDRIAIGELAVTSSRITIRDVAATRGRDPLLRAARVDIRYDARHLLFGGGSRYGLERIDVERPQISIVRHADGSFNVSGAALSGAPSGAGGGAAPVAPLRFSLHVRDGSVTLEDPGRRLAIARALGVAGISADARVDSAARTVYAGAGRLGGGTHERFRFAGRIDADGYAVHHLRADDVDLPPIVDYFINAPSAALVRGRAHQVDVRLYAFPGPHGAPYHLVGSAAVSGGAMHVPGLAVDATGMRGRIAAFDDGLVVPRLDARLGTIAVRLAGGLYGWRTPTFRLGIRAAGDLRAARALFRFSRRLPLAGEVALSTLLEGPVGAPLVAVRAVAPAVAYDRYPISGAGGRAIYADQAVNVVGAHARYGGLDVRVDGAIALGGAEPVTRLAVDAAGPAAAIPYAGQLAPGALLRGTGLLAGTGTRFDARGVAAGAGAGTHLGGLFHVNARGDGAFAPVFAERDDGARLAGAFYLDRSESRSAFWFHAERYPFADLGERPRLPGLGLVAPVFSAMLDGDLAGAGTPSDFRVAGHARARDLRVNGVRVDDVHGDVAGAFGNLRLGAVTGRGPWGAFTGSGAYASGRLALRGAYAGSFAQLRTFTGDVGGSGTLAGPVALLIEPGRTVVQSLGTDRGDARLRGVPVDAIDGTISVSDGRVRVYAATAGVAGGTFAAAGDAQGRGVGVSVAGANVGLMRLRGPAATGRLAAIGAVTGAGARSRFAGGAALGGGAVAGVSVSADGDLAIGPGRVAFTRTDAMANGAVGTLAGSVAGVGSATPAYDVALHVPSAALGPIAAHLVPARRGIAGTVGADLRVRGAGARAAVTGAVRIPEGTFDGLHFADAGARIEIDAGGVRATGGRVTVGSTRTAFSGSADAADEALRIDAPQADLEDFNDLFDAGDTLGGRGRVALRFSQHRGEPLRTDADIAIAGLRYRRFGLGDASAMWRSRGRDVTGSVAFAGPSGRLDAAGVLELPARTPLEAVLLRSRFDGHAGLVGLDLGVWLPALGIAAPIDGRVDATATIAGPLRDPAVTTTASLANGSIGAFPVDKLIVSAVSTRDRTTVRRVEIELPSVSIVGSGQFGLDARSPLALALHAESPNLGALSTRFFGAAYPVTGTGSADVSIDGSRADPRINGHLDVRAATLRGVSVPQASAAFGVRGRDVVLGDADVRFAAGSLHLAGAAPLRIRPFAVGPADAKIALTLSADDVELSDFAPLLPAGSVLRGRIDANLAVRGTAGAPVLDGRLTVGGATISAPFETVPLTDAGAEVRFRGDTAELTSLHAAAGGGRLDASGSLRLADLARSDAGGAYAFVAHADKLRLDLPAYGFGTVDGTVAFSRVAGGMPSLAGDLRLSDGTIPFTALLLAGGSAGGFDASAATATPPVGPGRDLALNLDVSAERNVRVRSANVDIGGRGDLHVSGTRAAPSLSGGFTSTGGTITYFNTVFRLIDGTVTFTPDLGVIPTLDARAVTHVIDPDPNTVRNASGTADVTLTLTGPVNNLTIGLSSDPAYERQQILGLLLDAPALGASNLFGETREQATLYGSNATASLPPGVAVFRTQTGELSVAQEAFGVANAQFTRTLLAPIETTFASAVGLSNFNVNVDYTGNVGVSARKVLGKKVNAVYGSTFGYPYRQTFGFEIKPNDVTAAQVTVFESLGVNGLNSLTPTTFTNAVNAKLGAAQPSGGTAGFSLSLQRLF